MKRRYAKTINFGLIYGMGSFGLAPSLGIERYFARYASAKAYTDETRASAKDKDDVETLFGRRIYLPRSTAAAARGAPAPSGRRSMRRGRGRPPT